MSDSPDIQTEGRPAAAYSWRRWRPHPVLPSMTAEEIEALAATPEGRERLATIYNRREKLIQLSETPGQLLDYAFEPECWQDADRDLELAKTDGRDYGGLYLGGGKRSTKSTYSVRTALRSWLTYSNGIAWAISRVLATSRGTIQRQMWDWMPQYIRAANDPSGKRKGGEVIKVRYTVDGGFAGDNVVFPNGTIVHFLSFNNDPTDYQGWEIGAVIKPQNIPPRELWPTWVSRWDDQGYAYDKRGVRIPNIGALLDEDAALRWIQTVRDRLTTRNAKFLWPFTTEKGITLAVKETIGSPRNEETRPVDDTLPSDQVLVPGCPKGHVPYRQVTSTPGVRAIYFHTRFNVFGDNYPNMKAQYRNATTPIKLANLYGYSEDVRMRAFPLFGGHNLFGGETDVMDWPAEGTNYLIGDPAGERNWFWIWVRIVPGMGKENWFIYDEWPDYATYREWAVPDEKPIENGGNPDGVAGPAQRGLGWGIDQYKRMIAQRERIVITPAAYEAIRATESPSHRDHQKFWVDPQKAKLAIAAIQEAETFEQCAQELALTVRERLLDPRAAGTESIDKAKGRTLIDKFHDSTTGRDGRVILPGLHFRPAPGLPIQTGVEAINDLLYFDKDQEMIPGLNFPRLFVHRRCRQVIWALENYTAQGGESGGCKDVVDATRYAATSKLNYVAPGSVQTRGGITR